MARRKTFGRRIIHLASFRFCLVSILNDATLVLTYHKKFNGEEELKIVKI
jgi:hypothetical protein